MFLETAFTPNPSLCAVIPASPPPLRPYPFWRESPRMQPNPSPPTPTPPDQPAPEPIGDPVPQPPQPNPPSPVPQPPVIM